MSNVVKIVYNQDKDPLDSIVADYKKGELLSLHVTALYRDGTIVPFMAGDFQKSLSQKRTDK